MKITFLNDNTNDTLTETAREYMKSRIEDFTFYMENGFNDYDEPNYTEDLPPFFEYGLSFDSVDSDDLDYVEYYRYQLSFGGPSGEIRFYPDRIEYVYLDWFCGVGFDVTEEEWAMWLRDTFEDMGMMEL